MKANTLIDFGDKGAGREEDQIVAGDPGGEPRMVRVSRSEDGKSICFTDSKGRSICMELPRLKPVASGQDRPPLKIRYHSTDTCSCCGCIYGEFDGEAVLWDPTTGGFCSHH